MQKIKGNYLKSWSPFPFINSAIKPLPILTPNLTNKQI